MMKVKINTLHGKESTISFISLKQEVETIFDDDNFDSMFAMDGSAPANTQNISVGMFLLNHGDHDGILG